MRHEALRTVTPLISAMDYQLEHAVDLLIAESEMAGDYVYTDEQAARAEALAIIGHELRRRKDKETDNG